MKSLPKFSNHHYSSSGILASSMTQSSVPLSHRAETSLLSDWAIRNWRAVSHRQASEIQRINSFPRRFHSWFWSWQYEFLIQQFEEIFNKMYLTPGNAQRKYSPDRNNRNVFDMWPLLLCTFFFLFPCVYITCTLTCTYHFDPEWD